MATEGSPRREGETAGSTLRLRTALALAIVSWRHTRGGGSGLSVTTSAQTQHSRVPPQTAIARGAFGAPSPSPEAHAAALDRAVRAACAAGGARASPRLAGAGVRAAHRLAQLRALTLHCGGSGAYNSIGGSDPAGTIDEHAPEEGFHRAWQVALRAAARAMVDAALPTHGGNSLGHYRHRAPGTEGSDARAFDRPPPDPQPAQEFLTTLASTSPQAAAAVAAANCEAFASLATEAQRLIRLAAALPSVTLASEAAAETAPRVAHGAQRLTEVISAAIRVLTGHADTLPGRAALGADDEVIGQLVVITETASTFEAAIDSMMSSGGIAAGILTQEFAEYSQCVAVVSECCDIVARLLAECPLALTGTGGGGLHDAGGQYRHFFGAQCAVDDVADAARRGASGSQLPIADSQHESHHLLLHHSLQPPGNAQHDSRAPPQQNSEALMRALCDGAEQKQNYVHARVQWRSQHVPHEGGVAVQGTLPGQNDVGVEYEQWSNRGADHDDSHKYA